MRAYIQGLSILLLGMLFLFCSKDPASPIQTSPSPITDLFILGGVDTSATLGWTAPADGNGEAVASYDFRYTTDSLILIDWSHAKWVDLPRPMAPNSPQTLSVHRLSLDSSYFFAIKSRDSEGELSDISNIEYRGSGESPKVLMSKPADGNYVADFVSLEVMSGDNKGVIEVDYWVDTEYVGSAQAPPFQVWWNSSSEIHGTHHQIYAIAKDAEQNETTSSAITVTIDTALGIPDSPLNIDLSVSYPDVTISWARTDEIDFSHYLVYRSDDTIVDTNDILVATISDQDSVLAQDFDVSLERHYFYVEVVDLSGKIGRSDIFTLNMADFIERDWALEFDGNNDYLVIPYFGAGLGAASFTIEMWIKPYGKANNNIVVGQGTHILELDIYSGSRGFFKHVSCSESLTNGSFMTDRWTHFAITYDNSMSYLYILIDGEAAEFCAPDRHVSINDLWIGARPPDIDFPFQGAIDEIRIWNRALSAQEIKDNMNISFEIAPSGLMGYYPIVTGVGSVVSGVTGPEAVLGSSEIGDDSEPNWIISDR